jgi:fatty acid desaturase
LQVKQDFSQRKRFIARSLARLWDHAAIAIKVSEGHMASMEQELRRPEYVPRKHDRAVSAVNCAMAAIGLTAMTLCLVGSAAIAAVWAIGTLFDASQTIFYILAAIVALPVLWLSVWTAGRAWNLERRLSEGRDVDAPVFDALHYFRSKH